MKLWGRLAERIWRNRKGIWGGFDSNTINICELLKKIYQQKRHTKYILMPENTIIILVGKTNILLVKIFFFFKILCFPILTSTDRRYNWGDYYCCCCCHYCCWDGVLCTRLASVSLCSKRWLWVSDPPDSMCQVLGGLQACSHSAQSIEKT